MELWHTVQTVTLFSFFLSLLFFSSFISSSSSSSSPFPFSHPLLLYLLSFTILSFFLFFFFSILFSPDFFSSPLPFIPFRLLLIFPVKDTTPTSALWHLQPGRSAPITFHTAVNVEKSGFSGGVGVGGGIFLAVESIGISVFSIDRTKLQISRFPLKKPLLVCDIIPSPGRIRENERESERRSVTALLWVPMSAGCEAPLCRFIVLWGFYCSFGSLSTASARKILQLVSRSRSHSKTQAASF